jgi:hypothetical protein
VYPVARNKFERRAALSNGQSWQLPKSPCASKPESGVTLYNAKNSPYILAIMSIKNEILELKSLNDIIDDFGKIISLLFAA